MARYAYECPVCGKETDSAIGMCRHITRSTSDVAGHRMWMAEHGIKSPYILGTYMAGTYKPLLKVVEEKCNKYEIEEHALTAKVPKPMNGKVVVPKGLKSAKNKVIAIKRQKQEEARG